MNTNSQEQIKTTTSSPEAGHNYKQEANTAIYLIKDILSKSSNAETKSMNLDNKVLTDLNKIGDLIQEHRITDNRAAINHIISEAQKYIYEKDHDLGSQTHQYFTDLSNAVRMVDWKQSE